MGKREKQTAPNPIRKSELELLKNDFRLLEEELKKSYEQIASLNRQKGGYIASNNAYRKKIETLRSIYEEQLIKIDRLCIEQRNLEEELKETKVKSIKEIKNLIGGETELKERLLFSNKMVDDIARKNQDLAEENDLLSKKLSNSKEENKYLSYVLFSISAVLIAFGLYLIFN